MTKTDKPHLFMQPPEPAGVDYGPLVRAAAGGDREAMERLLLRAQEVAFRFSVMVCGHAGDAEDVMQDALIKTYRHVSRIREPDAFRTWLYRTVRNACLMKRRRRVNEPNPREVLSVSDDEAGVTDVKDTARGPDEIAANRWLGRRLRQALMSLPGSYRMVVMLREMEGLSTREVAAVTGLSEANVKTRLHRARTMLRGALEDV